MSLDAASRLQLRQQEARPRLNALRVWLVQTRITVADGGATAKALDYSLKRWPALMRYADSGVLPIDNNPVENTIRVSVRAKPSCNYRRDQLEAPDGEMICLATAQGSSSAT